jgi:hypothetical protein
MTAENSITAERRESIWMLAISPTLWAIHFGACYITAAIWCAKVPTVLASIAGVRSAVAVFTIGALAGIGYMVRKGYRAHAFGGASAPHDDDTPEDRHRFMGYATFLLSCLSALAVVYTALVVVFVRTCQ